MEKKIIKFGAWENNEVEVENEIIIFNFSTNYGFELRNGMLVTNIEGKDYKMCYIGSSDTSYLKCEIKPYLRDNVTFKLFLSTKELVGKKWRTNAAVLTLIENIQYRFMLEEGIETCYGYNNIKDGKRSLIGLIPIDYEYNEIVDTSWNDYTGEYDIFTTREARPIEEQTA